VNIVINPQVTIGSEMLDQSVTISFSKKCVTCNN
jgi:hypothetical protein